MRSAVQFRPGSDVALKLHSSSPVAELYMRHLQAATRFSDWPEKLLIVKHRYCALGVTSSKSNCGTEA